MSHQRLTSRTMNSTIIAADLTWTLHRLGLCYMTYTEIVAVADLMSVYV